MLIYCVVRSQPWFFFSSRRRHTRLQGDWSSDVCSSDLTLYAYLALRFQALKEPRKPQGEVGIQGVLDELAGENCQGDVENRQAEIGRASCRERVWVLVGGGAVE